MTFSQSSLSNSNPNSEVLLPQHLTPYAFTLEGDLLVSWKEMRAMPMSGVHATLRSAVAVMLDWNPMKDQSVSEISESRPTSHST